MKDTPRGRDCDGATHSCRQLQRSLAMHEKSARYRRRWRTEASPTNAAWGSAATPLKVMIETELRTPGDSCNVLWPCQSSPQTTVANRAPQPPRLLRSAQLGHRSRSRLRRSCTLVASCNVLWQSTKTQKEKKKTQCRRRTTAGLCSAGTCYRSRSGRKSLATPHARGSAANRCQLPAPGCAGRASERAPLRSRSKSLKSRPALHLRRPTPPSDATKPPTDSPPRPHGRRGARRSLEVRGQPKRIDRQRNRRQLLKWRISCSWSHCKRVP